MFRRRWFRMLTSMSDTNPGADILPVDGSELGMSDLPNGTVTLLLADVEGSTQLWQTQPEQTAAAIVELDRTLASLIVDHDGVRPVEQGEGDSFVVAFIRASDALNCALALQRAPLAPLRLRIGLHTGEVRMRDPKDPTNYVGPTINRTARLRDLAHGGQTVLSGTTSDLVIDQLPAGVWLTDLGTHTLRDLPRPERVTQLCHPDLRNDFPPLRLPKTIAAQGLPSQLTSFVGREQELAHGRQLLTAHRLVTLTGAGGVGKTRLASQIAARAAGEFDSGVWYVDLAPITDPDAVPAAMMRALSLPNQPGRSTMDTLLRFVADRQMLIVLDNCEHLLDAIAELIVALLGASRRLTLMATSREPIGTPGEVTWRVPSLSVADESVELFSDRARRVLPDFRIDAETAAAVTEICRRLDGMPLAIELAAARVRALSLNEIVDGLHDRFRLLTGGARTAVRRQQTLHASVDWSHGLLSETERVMFRRLAVFLGGFDLDAAQAIDASPQRYHVLDQLTLLVDKSLVVAENTCGRTRYRLLETVRQYALDKLAESGEADSVRVRHRDHYTAMAALLDAPASADHQRRLDRAAAEIDNLRAAFTWSLENFDSEGALALASSLQPLWLTRGRIREGLAWFDNALADIDARRDQVAPAVRVRALADKAVLDAWAGAPGSLDRAEHALTIARDLDDPALLVRALTACTFIATYNAEIARAYCTEAIGLARVTADHWRLSQLLGWQAYAAIIAGNPMQARVAAEEGRDVADAIGDGFHSRECRLWLGWAQLWRGELDSATANFAEVITEAQAAHDGISRAIGLAGRGWTLAYQGDTGAARAAADAAIKGGADLGELYEGIGHGALAVAAVAAGDPATARAASEAAQRLMPSETAVTTICWAAQAALACGDLAVAQRWAEEAVSATTAWPYHAMEALATRARVALARTDRDRAEHDAHDALVRGVGVEAYARIPDLLECLANLAVDADSHREAARLFAAAAAMRERMGLVRFTIYDAGYEASVAVVRNGLGDNDFEGAWQEGAALSTDEAIGYAQRGRGERRRPSTGWASLTPAELDVVRLVGNGLSNNDIASRLFVSPRTVQSHLTHVYTKLGVTSRVQLAQQAARQG
ncbi:Putative HTH-type transcriptional regulator [Mycobacterium attenuatum]|uniref:HTH-type transcriptional regulator n=2 Tax=Mycobacterium attenuatum TaxID=2341086 RepID=A0A498QB78_9MYCO|nr:Putative HTH-type transcriptional regulator [Mycobacterium attenuatum]